MVHIILFACFFIIAVLVAAFFLLLKNRNKIKNDYTGVVEKYKDVINLDKYKEEVTLKTNQIINTKKQEIKKLGSDIATLKSDYSTKRSYLEKLLHEISLYEEKEEIFDYGLYTPHFDFDTSEKYKIEIQKVRNDEKNIIKRGEAAVCSKEWTVNGSRTEGKKETDCYIKLMLRAFNGECDSLIADVRWNNITKMEERLQKSFEAINKMGETHSIQMTNSYRNMKLKELRLTFEYQEKLYREKEEQKRIKEQMREEAKVQKEIEKALKDSQAEEERYNKALEQARKEMEQAQGSALEKLKEKMAKLQQDLEEAKNAHQRAISMAQQTKTGHVYIISNIGSFGENVYKIGMTRRLEPMDRVHELGDASVPFEFDVHAMIKSDNAPELENLLHKYFDNKRVNLVNPRKEFFYVSLDEIQKYMQENNLDIELTKLAEARDYRESEAIRKSKEKKKEEQKNSVLNAIPKTI